jgi:hypothetical protein
VFTGNGADARSYGGQHESSINVQFDPPMFWSFQFCTSLAGLGTVGLEEESVYCTCTIKYRGLPLSLLFSIERVNPFYVFM